MPWLTARRQNRLRLLSPPSLAMVAVVGVASGAALASLEATLQQQGLPPLLLLTAVPGLAVVATAAGVCAAVLQIQFTRQ